MVIKNENGMNQFSEEDLSRIIEMAWEDRREDSPIEYIGKLAEAKCNLNCGKELLEVVRLQYKIIEAINEGSTCLGVHELLRDMKHALTKTKELGL